MPTYSGNDVFPDPLTIPDDTAPPTAANINPAIEALADRTKYLSIRGASAGWYNKVALVQTGDDDAGNTIGFESVRASWTDTSPNVANVYDVGMGSPTLVAGDVVIARFSGHLRYDVGVENDDFYCGLFWLENATGSYQIVPGSRRMFQVGNISGLAPNKLYVPFSIMCSRVVVAGGVYRTKFLAWEQSNAASRVINLVGPYSSQLEVYRAVPS